MDQTSAESILAEHGLADLLPARLVARRRACTVWQLGLFAPYGDAPAEVQIYELREDPVSVVDFEEEVTAIGDSSERALVRELRDSDWGILVTCDRKDEALFRRFFQEGIPKERTIAYHPQLDRILGEDLFRQVEGRWVKTCMASLTRAMQLRDLVQAAEAAYQASDAWDGNWNGRYRFHTPSCRFPSSFQKRRPSTTSWLKSFSESPHRSLSRSRRR